MPTLLSHAIADAISRARCRDIGKHFHTEESIRGIRSIEILLCSTIAAKKNAQVINVDATVLAEAPKISPHISAMEEKMAAALGVKANAISIKAKTMKDSAPSGAVKGWRQSQWRAWRK